MVVLLLLALVAPARAQSIEAETLFNQGDALMQQGKLAQACAAFEASNRLEARAGTLIRLGECRERTQELASAWSAYKDALTRAKDPKKKTIAADKVKELEPRLSSLTITVAKAGRIDGLVVTRDGQAFDSALWNVPVPVNGGSYVIAARAPGKRDWQTTVKVGVEKDKQTVEVPALEPAAAATQAPPPPATATTAEPPPDDERAEPEAPSRFTTKRKAALGLAGGAAIGLAVGIVLGTQSKAKQHDADELCPQADACPDADRANELIHEARTRALAADIAFGVAGAAAIGAAVLWFTGAPARADTVAVVPGLGSLTVMGRF